VDGDALGYSPGMDRLTKPLAIAGVLNIPVWAAVAFGAVTDPVSPALLAIAAVVPFMVSTCACILLLDAADG